MEPAVKFAVDDTSLVNARPRKARARDTAPATRAGGKGKYSCDGKGKFGNSKHTGKGK